MRRLPLCSCWHLFPSSGRKQVPTQAKTITQAPKAAHTRHLLASLVLRDLPYPHHWHLFRFWREKKSPIFFFKGVSWAHKSCWMWRGEERSTKTRKLTTFGFETVIISILLLLLQKVLLIVHHVLGLELEANDTLSLICCPCCRFILALNEPPQSLIIWQNVII